MTRFDNEYDEEFPGVQPMRGQGSDPLRWRPIFPPGDDPDRFRVPEDYQQRRSSGLSRFVVLILIGFALWLGVAHHQEIRTVLASMGDIGAGHSTDQRTLGLVCFGLICVTIVSVVKILANHDRRNQ